MPFSSAAAFTTDRLTKPAGPWKSKLMLNRNHNETASAPWPFSHACSGDPYLSMVEMLESSSSSSSSSESSPFLFSSSESSSFCFDDDNAAAAAVDDELEEDALNSSPFSPKL